MPPPTTIASRAGERLAVALLPSLLALGAYANALGASFVWDDHALIEEQLFVRELHPLWTYFTRTFWTGSLSLTSSYYRPLTTLTYALDWALWDGGAFGFHLTNLFLHCGVVSLLFALLRRGGATPWMATSGASLFALHPRLTESVTWISGRTDVLATLAVLAAFWAWEEETRRRRWTAALLILFGLFAKEVAAAGLLALLVRTSLEPGPDRGGASKVARALPLLAAGATYACLRLFAVRTAEALPANAPVSLSPAERALAALAAVGEYARMLLDPLRPQFQIGSLTRITPPFVVTGALVLLFAGGLLVRRSRRFSPQQQTALITGAGALGLVLHLIPLNVQVVAADRFLYLPLAMATWALVPPLARWGRTWRTRLAVGAALLCGVFAVSVHARNKVWSDEYLVWLEAVKERAPGNTKPLQGLATYLMEFELHEAALPHLLATIREEAARPDATSFNNLAVALDKLGRRGEAVDLLERIVAQRPEHLRAQLNLAMALARSGDFDAALERLHSDRLSGLEEASQVAEVLRRNRAERAALGPRRDEEPLERVIARALLEEELGARSEAIALWMAVLSHPKVSEPQLIRGLGFMATHAEPDEAQSAVARVKARRPTLSIPEELLAHLKHRSLMR